MKLLLRQWRRESPGTVTPVTGTVGAACRRGVLRRGGEDDVRVISHLNVCRRFPVFGVRTRGADGGIARYGGVMLSEHGLRASFCL